METITSATKRKKRKTRKCLDELRKRSRRSTDSLIKPTAMGNLKETISSLNEPLKLINNNNYITTNRLTLAMFPKAIRSETITRPVLSNIQHNVSSNNFSKIVSSTVILDDKNGQPNDDSDFIKNSDEESMTSAYDRCKEMGQISLQKESNSEKMSTDDNISPRSFILFSPVRQSADTDLFEESPNEHSVSTPTSSSQSIRDRCGYQLYEEFMKEIPMYLKENAPALLKEDVMKKSRTVLHNVYMDSCRRECEDNILQCIKTSVSTSKKPFANHNTIIHNPMDYLRAGYVSWRQSTAPTMSVAPDAESAAESPAPQTSLIHDTPEYTYYPHKLNQ